jgi:hypothetical protein
VDLRRWLGWSPDGPCAAGSNPRGILNAWVPRRGYFVTKIPNGRVAERESSNGGLDFQDSLTPGYARWRP